jgi:hypothetical protein
MTDSKIQRDLLILCWELKSWELEMVTKDVESVENWCAWLHRHDSLAATTTLSMQIMLKQTKLNIQQKDGETSQQIPMTTTKNTNDPSTAQVTHDSQTME